VVVLRIIDRALAVMAPVRMNFARRVERACDVPYRHGSMSEVGHSRRSDRGPVTSGLPPIADIPSTVPLRALNLIGALSYARSSNQDSNLERI
jgi:hypothetical protein